MENTKMWKSGKGNQMWKVWLMSAFVFLNGFAFAQSDIDLADAYFQKEECEKAVVLYQKILKKDFNRIYLRRYANCQFKLKNWDETEKFFKKQRKDEKFGQLYNLYWGRLLELNGKTEEAQQKYTDASQNIKATDLEAFKELSEEFKEIENQNEAITTLLKARKVSGNENIFKMELAALYAQTGKTELMIEELLNLGMVTQNKTGIQNYLQDFLRDEKDQAKFEKILYDKIQVYPNEIFYPEMLIWHLSQKKQFSKALIQERALDKRHKFEGNRIFDLGNLALQNQDYDASMKCFEYVIKEYPEGQLYSYARRMVIVAREEQVKTILPIDKANVQKLIEEYKTLIADLGTNLRTTEAMRSMAILYGFYLNEKDSAIVVLQNAIEIGKSETNFVDKCKLDLGDIYLLKDESWESTLLYSQVEKSEKESVLGYEAKLRNARLNYYKGDFTLAKELLDILKLATTREIANDAEALSLLIQDNTGLDTSETAMQEYAAVELLLYQNKTGEALNTLDKLFEKYKQHSLADEILWLRAKTYFKMGENQKVVDNLSKIVDNYNEDILADDALFMIAEVYQNKLKDKTKAMELYQKLLEKYPASIHGADARKRFRQLRGDQI
jgi:tetratricopeptide (TPR) repeat protein